MLRKKRLKCGRIPVRLFLACHQKSNTFKCKQFCCAKPMCARLFMGCAPRPRERRAAVHSLYCSVGSSAHSPANALELDRVRARAACKASRPALSKHSRLSPLERALCSLFFANIASLYPPPAALRRRCPRSQIACSTAARLLETCSTGFIKSLALPFRSAVFDNLQRQTFHCRGRRLDTSTAVMPRHPHSVSLPAAYKSTLSGETP